MKVLKKITNYSFKFLFPCTLLVDKGNRRHQSSYKNHSKNQWTRRLQTLNLSKNQKMVPHKKKEEDRAQYINIIQYNIYKIWYMSLLCFLNYSSPMDQTALDALSRRPLTELPMLKLDEFICFLVNIYFFRSLSPTHSLALSPPHILILQDMDRFFSCKGNSKLLHRVAVMRMMMRFVVRGVSKCHFSSNEKPSLALFFCS